MKLSSHAHCIKIKDDLYAVYNNLLMDVLYMNYDEIKLLKKIEFNEIHNKELIEKGIYIYDLYADLKAEKKLQEIYEKKVGQFHIMYLIVSNACNLKCRYCFLENNPLYSDERMLMSEDIATTAVTKFCEYLELNKLKDGLIFLYGGEPLMNVAAIDKCIEVVAKCSVPVKISMITNGTLIDEKMACYLKKGNIDIGISIDGTEQLHNINRIYKKNGIGSFSEVNNARILMKNNNNKYGLSMTLSEEFLENGDQVIEWIKENEENEIFYNILHFSEPCTKWKMHTTKSANFVIKSYEALRGRVSEGRIHRQIDSIKQKKFIYNDCAAVGCGQFVVMPDGNIVICHGDSNTKKHILGNINEIAIENIIKTNEAEEWIKRGTIYNHECLKCEALYCCGGGCKLQAEILFGSRNTIDKPYCVYVKKVLKWILGICYNGEKEV